MSNLFYFTFGQKYRHQPHPRSGPAHPDGWVTVEADDANAARVDMFRHYGPFWAMQYDQEPSRQTFPRGELCRIKGDQMTTQKGQHDHSSEH